MILTILNLFIFLVLSIVMFYIPGFLLIRKSSIDLEDQETITLSFGLGIVCFVFLALILGFLNLRFISWPIIAGVNLLSIYLYKGKILSPLKIVYQDKLLLVMIILAILIQGFINFPSGYLYQNGLNFWSAQGHDGLWHVSVMEEIIKHIPARDPIFSGDLLYNYHYLVDVLMGEVARIVPFLTSLDLYFRFFPVLFSFMISISVFAFVSHWQKNKKIGYLGIFFTIFTGSLGYIVTFMRTGNILGGETVFWVAQGNTILGNPPHAIGFSLIPAFLLLLSIYFEKSKKYLLILLFILGAALAGYKVSAGFVLLVGLGVASVFDLIKNKSKSLFLLTFSLGLSNILTIKLMTFDIGNFLIWQPWWFIRTMVVAGDRLNWIDLENRRQFYLSLHSIRGYLRVLEYELLAFGIFLVGNIGTRVLGFSQTFRKPKSLLEIVMPFMMISGFVFPMLFVQRGITYNIIEFMQYFLLILGFYTALAVYKLLIRFKSTSVRVILFIFIALVSIPTVLGNLNEFYGPGKTPLSIVSNPELEALKYLKQNSSEDSIILVMPYNKYSQNQFKYQPRPIYVWYSTAYVSALSSRRTYLSSEEQASITGYPVQQRLDLENKFFVDKDSSWNKSFLKQNSINYLYLTKFELNNYFKDHNFTQSDRDNFSSFNGLEKFFENNEVVIYHVKDE